MAIGTQVPFPHPSVFKLLALEIGDLRFFAMVGWK